MKKRSLTLTLVALFSIPLGLIAQTPKKPGFVIEREARATATAKAAEAHMISLGMTKKMVRAAWGQPKRISNIPSAAHLNNGCWWDYLGDSLIFNDGKLVVIANTHVYGDSHTIPDGVEDRKFSKSTEPLGMWKKTVK